MLFWFLSVWEQRKCWHPFVKPHVRIMVLSSWFPLHELMAWCDLHRCLSAVLFLLAGFLCLPAAQRESWSHWAAACTHSLPLPVELERLREQRGSWAKCKIKKQSERKCLVCGREKEKMNEGGSAGRTEDRRRGRWGAVEIYLPGVA